MQTEILLGPPGTGKTTSLLNILDEELGRGVPPDRIGYVSFTRKAADEAATRAMSRFSLQRQDLPWFRTLHSLCFRQLGLRREEVLEGSRTREFASYARVRLTGRYSEDGTLTGFEIGDRILFMENLARIRGIPLREQYELDADDLPWREVERVAKALTLFKKEHALLDYTDMLALFVAMDAPPKLEVLLVDECFPPDTPVLVGLDGSWLTIGNIVESGYTGPVVSWHPEKGTVISRVTGHKKVLREKKMVRLKFCLTDPVRGSKPGAQIVVCTEDHRIMSNGKWIAAKDLRPGDSVLMETAQQRVASYQHHHKIGVEGKQKLADLHEGNKKSIGNKVPGSRTRFLKRKGGNGTGLSKHEQLFAEKMEAAGIPVQPYVNVLVGMGRTNGYPPHYKLDFYFEKGMIAIEIDGASHNNEEQKARDRKKEEKLQELGYTVVRFTNREVQVMTPQELVARLRPQCLVDGYILAVEDYSLDSSHVYDIQVEDTHCYFAHGLLVHNCQDLSKLQWDVVWLLARYARRVVCAGDDDQAIYRWAGADVETMISLPGDARVLNQSWRCPPAIQSLAGGIIGRVAHRRPKEWAAREGVGTVDRAVSVGALDLSGDDVLILARNEYILREQVEPELRRRGIIYERRGHSSLPLRMMAAVTDWERLRRGEELDVTTVREILEQMSAGRGVKRGQKKLPGKGDEDRLTMKELRQQGILLTEAPWFEALDRLPPEDVNYVRAALAAGGRVRERPRVRLSTIHGAKGGEAQHVVLSREIAARTHREMELSPEDEMRVWYVGVTRARERLTILDATTQRDCPWI